MNCKKIEKTKKKLKNKILFIPKYKMSIIRMRNFDVFQSMVYDLWYKV